MNENLDLTKILDGCPAGTEFYSSIFGSVRFAGIYPGAYPICLSLVGGTLNLTKKGTYDKEYDGECVLFPSKDQRDWSKFERFWDKPKVDRFDPKTLHPFDKVIVRDYPEHYWRVEIFSCITEEHKCLCTSFWKMGIPYNEETKHLVGTKEDCPDYYKWWEE